MSGLIAAVAMLLFVFYLAFVVVIIWRGVERDRRQRDMVERVRRERGR